MYKTIITTCFIAILAMACEQQSPPQETYEFLGYDSKEAWGEHLVTILDCETCHSPKIMTEKGPVPDPALKLSGHPASQASAQVDREVLEQNGYAATNSHMTSWTGPWGISYAGNLTPDATGLGNWSEENFSLSMRKGKFKGLPDGRTLLPPMPWPSFSHMTNNEISAIFAYLKTVTPIENIVPAADPPLSAMK